jgi:hypothetical protein
MTSFSAKIEKNKESHAYILGVQACRQNEPMFNPFEAGSSASLEWIDGYLDAKFLKEL